MSADQNDRTSTAINDRSDQTAMCPPCDIDLHDLCWWLDGAETAVGPCACTCHADHVRFEGTTTKEADRG